MKLNHEELVTLFGQTSTEGFEKGIEHHRVPIVLKTKEVSFRITSVLTAVIAFFDNKSLLVCRLQEWGYNNLTALQAQKESYCDLVVSSEIMEKLKQLLIPDLEAYFRDRIAGENECITLTVNKNFDFMMLLLDRATLGTRAEVEELKIKMGMVLFDPILFRSVERLNLPTFSFSLLKMMGVRCLGDLVQLQPKTLQHMNVLLPNIQNVVSGFGYTLGQIIPGWNAANWNEMRKAFTKPGYQHQNPVD